MLDQKTKESSKASDEIDLGIIFSKIFSFFKSVFVVTFKTFFRIFDRFFNNLKLILVLVVLGGGAGALYFYSQTPYYESSMTLTSDYFKGELLDNSIGNLNAVCSEGNSKVLSSLLKIPVSKASKIRSIKVVPILSNNHQLLVDFYSRDPKYKGKLDSLLMYNNESNFQLKVEVYDTAALKGLDTVLVNYIKENNFVKKRIEVDRANLLELRDKLARESSKLDTLKRSIASSIKSSGDAGRSGTNNVILGERTVNPIEIYREDLQLYNQRQQVEKQLALNAEIEVIEKFIPYGAPKSGYLLTNVKKGALAGLILGILFVLFQILREALIRLRYNLEEEQVA